MDLDDFAAVRAIVEAGTFSAAAGDLGIAQPALSRRVARIEERLGGRLFDRLPRRAEPTALGLAVAESAARIFLERDRAVEHAQAVAHGAGGRIRLGCLAGGISVLARGLARFQTARPDVWVEVRAMGPAAALDALLAREVDLATLPGGATREGVATRVIGRWRAVIVVRRGHPFALRPQVTIAELATEPVLLLSGDFMVTEHVRRLAATGGVALRPRLLDGTPEAALSMARQGLGAAIVPEAVRLPAGTIAVPLVADADDPQSDYVVAWLDDRTLSPAALELVDTLEQDTAPFRA